MQKFDRMLAGFEPMALSIFRIVIGLLLFQYGVAKLFKFPVLPYFANVPPLISQPNTSPRTRPVRSTGSNCSWCK